MGAEWIRGGGGGGGVKIFETEKKIFGSSGLIFL